MRHVLLDEMYDGKEKDLNEIGIKAYSVKKLIQ